MLFRIINRRFGKIGDLKECQKMILDKSRQFDYSNYILRGYYPKQIRQDFINIGWFNQELMRCVENVKEKSISINKLEFWSEQIQKVYDDRVSRDEPMTICLQETIQQNGIPQSYMQQLIKSKLYFIENREVKTMLQLETLSENMKMIQILINMKLLRVEFKQNIELMECIELMSRSIGIMEFIRRVPYNLRNYETYLPEDIMSKHNVNPKSLWDRNRGKPHPDLNDVVLECAWQSKLNLQKTTQYQHKLPPHAFRALLQGVEVEYFLENLTKSNFDIFDKRMNVNSYIQLPLRLFMTARKQQFTYYPDTNSNPKLK